MFSQIDELQARCVEQFYCGLSPDIAQGTACVMLQVFNDDSQTDEYYIVAGYVAPRDQWEAITPEWHHVLKHPPRLGYYRTSDAIALKGQFERFDEPSRNERIAELARTLVDHRHFFGVACWVSKKEFATYWALSLTQCEPWDGGLTLAC